MDLKTGHQANTPGTVPHAPLTANAHHVLVHDFGAFCKTQLQDAMLRENAPTQNTTCFVCEQKTRPELNPGNRQP